MQFEGGFHHGDIAEGEDVFRLEAKHRVDIGRPSAYALYRGQLFPRQAQVLPSELA